MTKRLRRGEDRVVAGVCSGLAERYDTDAKAMRILWAVLTVFTGVVPGIIAYALCWLAIPAKKHE